MKRTTTALLFATVAIILAALVIDEIAAIPSGGVLTAYTNSSSNGSLATARNDSGGYIYVANINTIQQNTNWKAYLGNVTGSLTLDDSTFHTIYDWDIAMTSGEVYSTRNSSVMWTTIGCAGGNNVSQENTYFGFNPVSADNINGTFNATAHKSFIVGTRPIAASSCNATALYVNDTRQPVTASSKWQETLLSDGRSLIFASIMEDNYWGYNNLTYDFQMILPENGSSLNTNPYYFWVELG
jgi:hypothetical protein